MKYLLPWVMLLAFVLGLIGASRRAPRNPRRMQTYHRWLFYMALIGGGAYAALLLYAGLGRAPAHLWTAALCWGLFVLIEGYVAFFRRPSDREIDINYGEDPGHCGRCGYDLTGNVSGVCPECGWHIPGPSHQWERMRWGMWWKEWQIEHLHDWRKTLSTTAVFTLAFAALAVWLAVWSSNAGFALIPGLMSISMLINSVRVIDYARRQRQESHHGPDDSGAIQQADQRDRAHANAESNGDPNVDANAASGNQRESKDTGDRHGGGAE